MKTITLDIIDDKAIDLLRDLEAMNIIKLHDDIHDPLLINDIRKLKGTMTKQSIEDIEKQFNDLRNEWN